jgi:hypothetical protein
MPDICSTAEYQALNRVLVASAVFVVDSTDLRKPWFVVQRVL